jgi:hypothetical protein
MAVEPSRRSLIYDLVLNVSSYLSRFGIAANIEA